MIHQFLPFPSNCADDDLWSNRVKTVDTDRGQTLKCAGIYLASLVFSHDQVYVLFPNPLHLTMLLLQLLKGTDDIQKMTGS
jgi:hypothetical protein